LRPHDHELLRDVPPYDVSVVDLPGGGSGRTPPVELERGRLAYL